MTLQLFKRVELFSRAYKTKYHHLFCLFCFVFYVIFCPLPHIVVVGPILVLFGPFWGSSFWLFNVPQLYLTMDPLQSLGFFLFIYNIQHIFYVIQRPYTVSLKLFMASKKFNLCWLCGFNWGSKTRTTSSCQNYVCRDASFVAPNPTSSQNYWPF